MLTDEDILKIYNVGPEAVVALVRGLLLKIEALERDNQELRFRVEALEAQLNKDSHNSSKPPSSDGLKKKKNQSLRKRSGRKPGGQEGHVGYTLEFSEDPTEEEPHCQVSCEKCGEDLTAEEIVAKKRRQVFELPPIKLKVTEHQSCLKICPQCAHQNWGDFPEEVKQPVQYGDRYKSFLVYLNQAQFLPYERSQELMDVLCEQAPSTGSINNAVQRCADLLTPFEPVVKAALQHAQILHTDETGIRVDGKLHWLHVSSTQDYSWYQVDAKRGREAMDRIGILPDYEGIAVHDHFRSYFGYDCKHALCNAHHLRELKHIAEDYQQAWATDMASLLREIKEALEVENLTLHHLQDFEGRYDLLLDAGLKLNPRQENSKRGRSKQTPARNLLERLRDYRDETLRFLFEPGVPFDNNQAERDVRMAKVQQKISGCFRSLEGAEAFARIRSFLSTMRKQGRHVLDELTLVFQGRNRFACVPPE
jgi:transposase